MNATKVASLLALVASISSIPVRAAADAPPEARAVLAQEYRWLAAIVAGNVKAIESILSTQPEYVHINADGKIVYRSEEIANTKKESFTMSPSEETVDFVGNVAIVHGVNTLAQSGKTIARVRFTDVFYKKNGTWLAVSAQETRM